MKKNIIKTFTFMFSAMFLAKVLGLLRNIVFAKFYGTGLESTAFFTASRIPTQLLDITLGAAISSTFIPVFNEFLQKEGKKRAFEFANHFLNVIILISGILSIIGIVLAPQVVKLIAPKLDVQAVEITITLTRILFPVMLFTAVAVVFVGLLQSLDEFNIPAIISVVSNGILIGYLFLFNDRFGIKGVAVAMLFGWLTQILVQIPSVYKKGFRYHPSLDFKDEGIKKIVVLALPILISTWVQPINNIVNIRLASGLEQDRAVSAIEYAYTLFLIIVGVFSYTLSNIVFPELSKLSADKKQDRFNELVTNSIKITVLFVLPMAMGMAFLSHNMIKIIYERGEFTEVSTMLTANALKYYAIGMIGYGIMELLNKVFYAFQDSKTPMKTSLFAILFNIILSLYLVKMMGYVGLPLAASITSIVTAIMMLTVIIRKMHISFKDVFLKDILKCFVATFLMGMILYLIHMMNMGIIIETVLMILYGVGIYFAVLLLLRSQVVLNGIDMILKRK